MDSSHTPLVEREFGEFVVDSHTPETIPMARLAEYMATLSALLGKDDAVHFERVEKGSLKIRYWTPKADADNVAERSIRLNSGEPDKSTLQAFQKMNDLLEADRAIGTLTFSGVVVPFPGRDRVHVPIYGPLDEEMAVEGQLVRIGGKDKSIHAQLRDGAIFYNCQMTRGLAMEMCHFLFGPTIRVTGRAKWQRDRDGDWQLQAFFANKFEEMDDAPLAEVVRALRGVENNGWAQIEAPLAELNRLSHED